MRAFILVALLAMAATVSCQDLPPVSPACNSSSTALDVPAVNDAEKAITRTGCTEVDLSVKSCTFDNITNVYNCKCEPTAINNKDAWEAAVRNVSGQPCYLSLGFTLTGTVRIDNTTTKPVTLNATQTNYDQLAVGGACNQTEIAGVFTGALTAGTAVLNKPAINSESSSTGVTWSTGTVSVSACGVVRTSAVVNIPQPSTGSTGGSSTGGSSTGGASTGGSTNNPTGGTTGSSTAGKNNGASIIAQSAAAAVASIIAIVAILA